MINTKGEYRLPNPQKRTTAQESASVISKVNKEHPITSSQNTRITEVLMREFPDHRRYEIKTVSNENKSTYWVY